MKQKICWVFCTVIDHFGDVGVSWRLARELHMRLNYQVFLWLDEVSVLSALAGDFGSVAGVVVKRWREGVWADLVAVPAPDLVIEMFACQLPDSVLAYIRANQVMWLNWEYLSAESWAVRTHGMRSLQADGTMKFFWQMGFVPESGGLLREAVFRLPEGVASVCLPDVLKVFVFGYASGVWVETLRTWLQMNRAMVVDVASEQVLMSLRAVGFLPDGELVGVGDEWVSGCLKIRRRGFVAQVDFDDLLAEYDVLFVRGEDSFVRAQWSGKPFFWHIYPQDEGAHWVKLAAFWALVFGDSWVDWQQSHQALSRELNGEITLSMAERLAHWQRLWQHWQSWQQSAQYWQTYLFNQSDTMTRLANWLAIQEGAHQ